jgi:hypothetical protein
MNSEPDKSNISLVCCNNEKELSRYNVDQIAHELWKGHVPRLYPIFLVFYKGDLRGYVQIIRQPCVYTTLHPELMNVREYLKITRSLITEIKRQYAKPLFMLCNRALNGENRVLKLGRLNRAEETAFVYDNEAY